MKNKTRLVRTRAFCLCSFFMIAIFSAPQGAAEESNLYKIGVLAHRGKSQCMKQWLHTALNLSDRIPGSRFEIVPLDFSEVTPAVAHKAIDFLIANPAIYVQLESHYELQRIATLNNLSLGKGYSRFGGVIFTRAQGRTIRSMEDLKGKIFAAVDPESMGGWLAAYRELKDHSIKPEKDFKPLLFKETHDAVVYAVLRGEAEAGTVRTDTLERMISEGKIDAKEITVLHEEVCELKHGGETFPFKHSTRLYPEWPFAKLVHIPADFAKRVAIELFAIEPDDIAAVTGYYEGWTVPLNYQPVHDCLKELRFGIYKDYGKVSFKDVLRNYWPWMTVIALLLAGLLAVAVVVIRLNRRLAVSRSEIMRGKEKAELIYKLVPSGIYTLDLSGRITSWNNMAVEITGYSSEEALGKKSSLFIEETDAQISDLLAGSEAQPFMGRESYLRRKDGQRRLISRNADFFRAPSGQILGGIVSFEDVTERKKAAEALRESEEKFRAMSTAAHDAMIMMNPEGKISFWNAAAERIFHYTAEEALGKDLHDLLAPSKYHGAFQKGMAGFRQTGQGPVVGKTIELTALRKSGMEFPVELSVSGVGLGDKWHAVGILRDITERKITDAMIRESETRFRSAFEHSGFGMALASPEGKFLKVNRSLSQTFEYEPEELLTMDFKAVTHPEDAGKDGEWIARTLAGEMPGFTLETRYLTKSGRAVWAFSSFSLVRDEQKQPVYFIIQIRDITLRKRAEIERDEKAKELERSNKELEQFAYIASHDLQEPLRKVTAFGDLLVEKAGLGLDEESRDYVKRMQNAALRMKILIEDLLNFSRVMSHRAPFQQVDLNRTLAEVLSNLEVRLKKTNATVEVGPLPVVTGADRQMVQLFQNLVSNALKYGKKGTAPLVKISAQETPSAYEIAVCDNGIGFDTKYAERIFVPFQRLHTREEYEGTGIGLAICKKIADLHGGQIRVESKVGEGSIFTVQIPKPFKERM